MTEPSYEVIKMAAIFYNIDSLPCLKAIVHMRKPQKPGLEVIKLEFILKPKIKCNDWLLADTCPQAANHFTLF